MPNITELSEQAIKAALSSSWKQAIEINKQILQVEPKNIQALNRIGKSYMELGEIKHAKKYFKATLKLDPINTTAEKNLKILLENPKKTTLTIKTNSTEMDTSFVIEPATTAKVNAVFEGRFNADSFESGDILNVRYKQKAFEFHQNGDKVAQTTDISSLNLKESLNGSWQGKAVYISGNGKNAEFLIKSETPIFRSKKQDIRPYTKHEELEEVELEIPEEE